MNFRYHKVKIIDSGYYINAKFMTIIPENLKILKHIYN
jgi:hypothetical protein